MEYTLEYKIRKELQPQFDSFLKENAKDLEASLSFAIFLMSQAFNYGYEIGLAEGRLSCDEPDIKNIPLSDNVE